MPKPGKPMHATTQRVLHLFRDQPNSIMDAHDVADAALIPYRDALTAVRNLARYDRITHIGGYLYTAGPRAQDRV
jgi:hypothetical protein